MNVSSQTLGELVARLASLRGLRGCAIVEADYGLVWTSQGELADRDTLWEAAIDFWRLQTRHATHFAELGKFGAAVMYHHDGMLAIFSCCRDPDLLFVAVGRLGVVDWLGLQREAAEIGRIVKDGGPVPASSSSPSSSTPA